MIGFVAGMFPLVSIEAFLVGFVALEPVTWPQLVGLALLGAVGHQIAKTVCYVAGVGALERGRVKALLERWRPRIERWNRHPWWIFFFAETFGIPPMWLIGFVAKPIMHLRFAPFTIYGYALRAVRYGVLASIAMLAK